MGMGARIPRIVSPITGEEEAEPSLGYMFETNEENMRRWRSWWRVANQEHFITFFVLGLLSLIALSVLVYATVGVQDWEGPRLRPGRGRYSQGSHSALVWNLLLHSRLRCPLLD